jgi:hypothetical protein
MDMMDTLPLHLYSLGTEFRIVKKIEVINTKEAEDKVREHLKDSGYTNLRTISDSDGSLRFIADPPKGRKGRNVAALDF